MHIGDGPVQEARDEALRREMEAGGYKGEAGETPNQWADRVCRTWVWGFDSVGDIERLWAEDEGRTTKALAAKL